MPVTTNTTQDFVPIREVRNGVLILKDGSLRSILMVSSMNFSLKSDDERKAILFGYQTFLNSLDFSTQIYIQSRKLDIRPYVGTLENRMAEQTNELLKIQIKEYIEFIKFFTTKNNVMTKSFFVVVSYTPPMFNQGNGGVFGKITGFFGKKKNDIQAIDSSFEENVEQLNQRKNVVEEGLNRLGLRAEPLGTEELIELFFKMFNPGETEIPDVSNIEQTQQ